MSKKAPRIRKNKKAEEYEAAAEDIADGYFMLVICGEHFSDESGDQVLDSICNQEAYRDRKLTTKTLNKAAWVNKDPETFFGFWGEAWNRYMESSVSPAMRKIKRWRVVLYDEEDERYKEDANGKKGERVVCPRIELENKVPEYSKRFYLLTNNMDNDVHECAFEEKEYLEKKGTIKEWHCSKKCLKKKTKVWRPDEFEEYQFGDFRFEINEKTKLAPAIKYVNRNKEDKLNKHDMIEEKQPARELFRVGDREDYNDRTPHGYFNYDRPVLPFENSFIHKSQTRDLADQRTMYFKYFNASSMQRLANKSDYQRLTKNNPRDFKSIYAQGGILKRFEPETHYHDTSRSVPSDIISHEISYQSSFAEKESIEQEKAQLQSDYEQEDLVLRAQFKQIMDTVTLDEEEEKELEAKKVSITEQRKELQKRLELQLQSIDERVTQIEMDRVRLFHEELHQDALEDQIDPRNIGECDIQTVDPMIQYHSYVSELSDNASDIESNTVLRGSEDEYYISLRIKDVDHGVVVNRYAFGPMAPSVRKQNLVNRTYRDSIIINVHDFCPDHVHNVLPDSGQISLVIESMRGKNQFKGWEGHNGMVALSEMRPYQILSKYSLSSYHKNKQEEIFGVVKEKQMVDYVLNTQGNTHRIILRTIQYENMKCELVNIFIDLPISNFQRNPNMNPSLPENLHPVPKKIPIGNDNPRYPRPTTRLNLQSAKPFPASTTTLTEEEVKSHHEAPKDLPPQHDPKLKPQVNRFLCKDCGALARPHVKMGRIDKKWVKNPLKMYKRWVKHVVKELSEDGEKTLVIVELGAGKALRKTTDKLFKQTKAYGTRVVRIHPNPPKTKKKEDGEFTEACTEIKAPVPGSIQKINDWVEELSETVDMYFK